ncbi:transposase [Clostridium sp. 'deep sea']|uniref:transposase n=1 Tax=Clostridium sp. 'deep sea' TaxID=2779445 RepID=UPI00189641F0|nr:transposase [Clostridium sp. 'deep sea']QOR34242.1 transposase [Clostridium sp. 'deep sea']
MTITTKKQSHANIYHILTKGNNKTNLFNNEQDYNKYLQILHNQKQTKAFELYGYSLNGNHVHLIIKQQQEPISNIIKAINISYARYFNHKYNREGHLFQGRYQSEIINSPNHLLECVKYLHYENGFNNYTSFNSYQSNNTQLVDTNFLAFIINNLKKS